jgi:hypothetical protein
MKKPTCGGLALRLFCQNIGNVKIIVNVVSLPLFSKYLVRDLHFIAPALLPYTYMLSIKLSIDALCFKLK